MISRDQALLLLDEANTPPHLRIHALETEAVLTALAQRLGHDPELWGRVGLLHDLDYPATQDSPELHGIVAANTLGGMLPEAGLAAIRAHNEATGLTPTAPLDFALRCGETVTGLIHAAALVRPERTQGLTASSLRKKMKDKRFAAAVCRKTIAECSHLDLPLDEFLTLATAAIHHIADEVGLT
ncbi:MAG: HDIG domain-containing metalloprotein [Desulfomicrobiaceae bacterium]